MKLTKKIPAKLGGIAYENLYLKGGFVAEASYDMEGNIKECCIRSDLGATLRLIGLWQVEGGSSRNENSCTVVDTIPGCSYVVHPL